MISFFWFCVPKHWSWGSYTFDVLSSQVVKDDMQFLGYLSAPRQNGRMGRGYNIYIYIFHLYIHVVFQQEISDIGI